MNCLSRFTLIVRFFPSQVQYNNHTQWKPNDAVLAQERVESSATRIPRLVLHGSRKSFNKLMHALNGNTAQTRNVPCLFDPLLIAREEDRRVEAKRVELAAAGTLTPDQIDIILYNYRRALQIRETARQSRVAASSLTSEEIASLEDGRHLFLYTQSIHANGPVSPVHVAREVERFGIFLHYRRSLRQREIGLRRPHGPPDWQPPSVPSTPADFATYSIDPPDACLLSDLNPHPRDSALTFHAPSHVYRVNGVETLGSVTGLVHQFSHPFQADRVIEMMSRSRNWPRPGYLATEISPDVITTLRSYPVASHLVDALMDPQRDEALICRLSVGMLRQRPDLSYTIRSLAMGQQEIVAMWAASAADARHRGTWMHLQAELWLNRCAVQVDCPEMELFVKFGRGLEGLVAYRTEWMIHADEERMAGSIDFVARDPQGDLVLFDWKRSKSLFTKYVNGWQRMMSPLEHLDDCAGVHYRLQLNCYRFILQKYYGVKISSMHVVCFHPDNGRIPFVDDVPLMEAEVRSIMDVQRNRVREIFHMEAHDPLGSHSQSPQVKDVCLVVALQSLGLPVQPIRPGPLRAMRDGNELLCPWGLTLEFTQVDAVSTGLYVVWTRGHFKGVRMDSHVTVFDGHHVTHFTGIESFLTSCEDVPFFYRLLPRTRSAMEGPDPLGGGSQADDDLDSRIAEESAFLDESVLPESFMDDPGAHVGNAASRAGPANMPSPATPAVAGSSVPSGFPTSGPCEQAPPEPDSTQAVHIALLDTALAGAHMECESLVEPEALMKVKKRRLMPGASSSCSDFHEMFSNYSAMVSEALQEVQPEVASRDASILQRTARLRQQVRLAYPAWDQALQSLATGALAIYRMRLGDMFIREHVLLLWIIEGERFLRVHNGVCHLYHDEGAFQPYKGIPPEATFGRVKEWLLQLEGLFRLLPDDVKRTDSELLAAINDTFVRQSSLTQYLRACEDAAIFCKGDKRGRKGGGKGKAGVGDQDEVDDAGEVPVHWHTYTAQALSKVGLLIQRELLEERLITYTIEWCQTPCKMSPGCCYTDTCVLYDVESGETIKHVSKSPDNNVYVRVPHPLLDPVAEDAVRRLQKFFAETFWCNANVFICCQAAQALAKRYENIDRCFIGVSPGGVGQSLYSHHLNAVYGHNHAFFDPNVWYQEDELRKQIEQFAGCIIITGQEAPESTRKFREDLFKKTMSADGIAGRKPYGIATRMLEIIGWKRVEVNKLIRFSGISERNFQAILRRALVWKPRGLFVDASFLQEHYADHASDGVFPADPTLKPFLVSGPAVAASLRIQHAFELAHTRLKARGIIEQYAALGGDAGITEQVMRESCGLSERKSACTGVVPTAIAVGDTPSQERAPKDEPWLGRVADVARQYCLSVGMDHIVFSTWALRTLPDNGPGWDKATVWKNLSESEYMIPVGQRGKTGKPGLMPRIRCEQALADVFDLGVPSVTETYAETYNLESLKSYLHGHPAREANVATFIQYFDGASTLKGRRRGKLPKDVQSKLERLASKAQQLRFVEQVAGRLVGSLDDATQGVSQASQSPNRKLTRKCSKSADTSRTTVLVSKQVTYHYTLDDLIRTRLQVQGIGVQACPRRILAVTVPHTIDLDIENCMCTLLHQLVDKLKPMIAMPTNCMEALKKCATDRASVCTDDLHMTLAEGKQLITCLLNGASPPADLSANEFVRTLRTLSRYLRWLACSLLPEVYKRCLDEPSRKFPEASTLTFMWSALEDRILASWVGYAKQHANGHLSLHFDGIRITDSLPCPVEEFCQRCSTRILEETGFTVRIREKKHHWFFELLRARCEEQQVASGVPEIFARSGNCIPAALFHLLGREGELIRMLEDKSLQSNAYAETRGCRSYNTMALACGCTLVPSHGIDAARQTGSYIVHAECDGRPHCVAVRVSPENTRCQVFDGNAKFVVETECLVGCAHEAMDSGSIVTFAVFGSQAEAKWPEEGSHEQLSVLLDLLAGGKRRTYGTPNALGSDLVIDIEPMEGSEEDAELEEPSPTGAEDSDQDESIVKVGDEILESMRREVEASIRRVRSGKVDERTMNGHCPLCPFRGFGKGRRNRVIQHLVSYHDSRRQYCCSGTKQIKGVVSMHDLDQLRGVKKGEYLRRTAEAIRKTVRPPLDVSRNNIDRDIRLALTETGPVFVHKDTAATSEEYRRVRNIHYTHGFAETLFRECLLYNCKALVSNRLRRVQHCIARYSEQGSNMHSCTSRAVRTKNKE